MFFAWFYDGSIGKLFNKRGVASVYVRQLADGF